MVGEQQQLRGAVPACHHVVGQLVLVVASGKPEVAYQKIAVAVHKEVARLKVAMKDVRTMDVLQRPQCLVDEVLVVLVGQLLLRPDNLVEIGVLLW